MGGGTSGQRWGGGGHWQSLVQRPGTPPPSPSKCRRRNAAAPSWSAVALTGAADHDAASTAPPPSRRVGRLVRCAPPPPPACPASHAAAAGWQAPHVQVQVLVVAVLVVVAPTPTPTPPHMAYLRVHSRAVCSTTMMGDADNGGRDTASRRGERECERQPSGRRRRRPASQHVPPAPCLVCLVVVVSPSDSPSRILPCWSCRCGRSRGLAGRRGWGPSGGSKWTAGLC